MKCRLKIFLTLILAVTQALHAEEAASAKDLTLTRDDSATANAGSVTLSYADVVATAQPSVVTILTLTYPDPDDDEPSLGRSPPDGRFNLSPGVSRKEPVKPHPAGGSGVVLTAEGHIITNNHVVEGAHVIKVRLPGSTRDLEATLVGKDPGTDIALLKVNTTPLKPITVTDSSRLRPGDVVLALGSPFGFEQTVTLGIVSGTGRVLSGDDERHEDLIQTDAPINPGNSGGALVDGRGRLVGINTATYGGGWMPANSIGFAVPSTLATRIANDLLVHGRVIRGFLGVGMTDLSEEEALKITGRADQRLTLVTEIHEGSPAHQAGFEAGDIITALNGVPMPTRAKLHFSIGTMLPGAKGTFTVLRGGKPQDLVATLTRVPERTVANANAASTGAQTLVEGLEVNQLTEHARHLSRLPQKSNGVLVTKAGADGKPIPHLKEGDVILQINGKPTESPSEAAKIIADAKPGQTLMLRLWRNGEESFASIRKKAD